MAAVSYNELQTGSCYEALQLPTQIFHKPFHHSDERGNCFEN